jgi:hypothetical protein
MVVLCVGRATYAVAQYTLRLALVEPSPTVLLAAMLDHTVTPSSVELSEDT